MKNLFRAIAVLMAVIAISFSPIAANATQKSQETSKSLVALLPSTVIVEQTATLKDGRSVTIYYKKSGDYCEVYSNDNLNGFSADDLLNLSTSTFSITSETEGKCLYRCPISKARSIIKNLVNQYL